MRQLWRSISKTEWLVVGAVAVAVIALAGLPYLYGYYQSTPDQIYVGLHAQMTVDFAVYISYIKQVVAGNYLIKDLFTTEPQPQAILNLAWLAVGLLARVLALNPRLAYHAARLVLAPLLLGVAYLLVSYFYKEKKSRLAAFFILAFAGGWGFYGIPIFTLLIGRVDFFDPREFWPADLEITESYIFSAIYQSPHFILSWIFQLLIFLFYLLAFDKKKIRYFIAAGLLALVFLNFHPYYAFLIFGVVGLYYLYQTVVAAKFEIRLTGGMILSGAIGGLSVIYHAWLIVADPLIGARAAGNVTMIYFFLPFFFCFGTWLILGGYGIFIAARRKLMTPKLVFCLIWIGVSLLLIFFPNPFQRHYYEGLFFPLTIFSIPALSALKAWLKKSISASLFELLVNNKLMIVILFFFVFSITHVYNLTRDLYYYNRHLPIFYISADNNAALNWLDQQPEKEKVILAGEYFSHFLPGFTGYKVFAGHGTETIDYNNKKIIVLWFFSGNSGDDQKLYWLKTSGIDYIYYSPEEKKLGDFDPAAKDYLKLEKKFGQTEVYQVRAE